MPTRDTPWPAGTPCWVDLSVPDVKAATEFYGPVMGWTFTDTGAEYGHYHMCQVGDRVAAAIGPLQQPGQPVAWTVFLASDDADATAKLVAENGGTVIVEPFDIGDQGRILVALDNTGGAFGVWQAKAAIGANIANEPGSLAWEDARLTDPEAGKRFYTAVFGYTYEPIPDAPPDYGLFKVNGEIAGGLGGMMGAPDGTPSHWVAYFSVADVDAAVAAVERGGGSVQQAPTDTPYGRMAFVTDPFGAAFALAGSLEGS
ncbi:VOC family protein [Pseudonocardia acaciae]|uniref:VOC family protein n=1 Tax=Pseudonocardia acaciae TaxID=551276 RepID=UPI00048BF338|nr:VOC family protein [Pseudonocardia acaciae]